MENQVAPGKNAGILYLALELSRKEWQLGSSDGSRNSEGIEAGDPEAGKKEIEKAKRRLGLKESAPNPS